MRNKVLASSILASVIERQEFKMKNGKWFGKLIALMIFVTLCVVLIVFAINPGALAQLIAIFRGSNASGGTSINDYIFIAEVNYVL